MKTFTIYDPATGEIERVQTDRSGRMTVEDFAAAGEAAIETAGDPGAQWVSGGVVTERPTLPGFDKTSIAADGTDTAKLTGLPIPCTVVVDGDPITVEDGELWISSTTAATYAVEVEAFPFLPYRAEVTAA